MVADKTFNVITFEWNDIVDWDGTQGLYYRVTTLMHKANVKVSIGLGGWKFNENTGTYHIFSDMVSTATNREKFIKSAIKFARDNNFDGVEIDWE